MYIEELNEEVGDLKIEEEQEGHLDHKHGAILVSDAKRVLVGVGVRALFYPTLLYNIVRNKIQTEFRWWDRVDEFILLGAVPFPADVPRLKELGVSGVVTLNEPYETLVPTSLYHAHNIDHLMIPTRDYLFAPSYSDICQAVNFVHENASCGKTTYVHCKAGRGRSTTIVLCYLVEHKQMTPEAAFDYVRSIRPRVLLASSQWQLKAQVMIVQAIEDYYFQKVKKSGSIICWKNSTEETVGFLVEQDEVAFDDDSAVVVTESDLDGYDGSHDSSLVDYKSLAVVSVACRFQFASQAAMGRLSSLWLHGNGWKLSAQKPSGKKLGSSVAATNQLGSTGVDIKVC